MTFRLDAWMSGRMIHCRVWVRLTPDAVETCLGTLVLGEKEWRDVKEMLAPYCTVDDLTDGDF